MAVASTVLVVMVASACATATSPGGNSGSTFGADSPWLGPFTPAALPALVNSLTALD